MAFFLALLRGVKGSHHIYTLPERGGHISVCLLYTSGVEFFISQGQLIVNEMAPRPHNSGHYTIDACITNQFEQQVRTLCGLPLGEARAHSASVMVNLLGDLWYDGEHYREPDWAKLYAVPNLKLHLYGKHLSLIHI